MKARKNYFFLIQFQEWQNLEIVTDKPIVVIDGKPYRYQDLENQKLSVSKNEIVKIMPIEKQKGKNIYGEFGEAGVLIITTSKAKSE